MTLLLLKFLIASVLIAVVGLALVVGFILLVNRIAEGFEQMDEQNERYE